jgi:anti-sigma factor RsiW
MQRNAQHAFDAAEVMAYLDGELEPHRAAALAAHLVSCSECQEVAQGFRALSERMLSFEVEHPSAGMNEKVRAALDSSSSSKRSIPSGSEKNKSWNWRRIFARPYVWAFAGLGLVALLAVVSIPSFFRSRQVAWLDTQRATGLSAPRDYMESPHTEPLYTPKPGLAMPMNGRATQTSAGEGWNAPTPPPVQSGDELKAPETIGPMIVQTASLNILATNYDEASAAIEKLAAAHGGYVEKLDAKAQTGNARELSAALRIPTKQLDGFRADVRKLGHVEEETRSNEEVSDQYVDLQARLKSARATEQRLIELLGTRTGKLEDVLETERELARIRGEIESMQGQSAILVHRVNYATVQVELSEEYRQVLGSGPISTSTKIRNAAVEGLTNFEDGAVALVVFVFAVGPSLLFWLAILLVPGWLVWRRFRRHARS